MTTTAKSQNKAKAAATRKPTPKPKVGVISTIVSMIEQSGDKGVTKDGIHAKLVKQFPDRSPVAMRNTISVQVPARINKERFKVERLEGGLYRKAK